MTWAIIGLGLLFTLPIIVLGAGFLVMMIARPGLTGARSGPGRVPPGQAPPDQPDQPDQPDPPDPRLLGPHGLGDHPDQQPPGPGD
ncbi:hypothetical protein JS278_00163 [Acidipropionibacterium virtanenii]|uniref:Uncharacterized protein n=1 Tax=Acidipropionibacterium virtanenii TaxID=2057246 RepID=A0A344UQ12_9ACTN|nr:hypothetical protein JS278_00163 [Acidipropionibacterium virtanenii]